MVHKSKFPAGRELRSKAECFPATAASSRVFSDNAEEVNKCTYHFVPQLALPPCWLMLVEKSKALAAGCVTNVAVTRCRRHPRRP